MTFAEVRAFLGASTLGMSTCFDCHASRLPLLFKDDDTLYDSLTTRNIERCNGQPLVVPADPDNSVLYLVLKGECGTVGRMPSGCYESPDGLENNCTAPADIERIRLWIEEGAPR
jgi:hypothetical protein